MKFAIIGFGKMGRAIEQIAKSRGHKIPVKYGSTDSFNSDDLKSAGIDTAIEFTEPSSAFNNITMCIEAGIPVISGTTGWLDRYEEAVKICNDRNGSFLYASNFSIGVNILFELNRNLAHLMNRYPEYRVSISETHHIHKADRPSGTAITLAQDIIASSDNLKDWILESENDEHKLNIVSHRQGEVIGDHSVEYSGEVDILEIKHHARNRSGFAAGAVIAAEWISQKSGVFTMQDLLKDH